MTHIMRNDHAHFTRCDTSIDKYSLVRCGKGRISIMYRKTLKSNIELLDIGNDRLAGIKLRGPNPRPYYIFVNILPANNDINFYRD